MTPATPPPNDSARVAALRAYGVLDTPPETDFDEITQLAAQVCATPVAIISLLDENRQWIKSRVGLGETPTSRDAAFCAHVLEGTGPLVVPDATQDSRFADHPLVTGELHLRFYAGMPLVTPAGYTIGTLSVIDRVPRQLRPDQLRSLQALSRQVMLQLELRRSALEVRPAGVALHDSEELFRAVFEQAAVGICVVSLDYRFLRVNERFAAIIGYPVATLLGGGHCVDTTHPDDRAADAAAIARLYAGAASASLDKRYVRQDGRAVWAHLTLSLLRSAEGTPQFFLGVIEDITKRKRAEEERDRLFNLSEDLLCIANFDGRFEQMNPAWTRCLGWSAEELTSRPSIEFVLDEDRDATLRARENLKVGEGLRDFENRYRCKDGSYRWLSWNSHPLAESRQIFCVARDVTEHHARGAQLRLLETSISHLNDIVMITEADLIDEPGPRIVFVNEAFERVTGYTCAEALGQTPRILQGPDTDRAQLARLRDALVKREPVHVELLNYSKAGRAYWIEVDLAPVWDAAGHVTHFVAVERDITERKLAAEAVRQQAELLRQSEAQYRLLFADNPQPMWVFEFETLRFLAVNPAAALHYGYTAEEFLRLTLADIRPPEDLPHLHRALAELSPDGQRSLRTHHRKKDGTIIDVDITYDGIIFNGRPSRLVVAHDVTAQVQAGLAVERSTRALQLLSRCNEALSRSETEQQLLDTVCQLAVDVGGFRLAWVGYPREDDFKTIAPQAHAGPENGYLAELRVSWSEDRPEGHGPAGRVIRSGEPIVITDLSRDESFRPWAEPAQARGFLGVAVLPLKHASRTFGILVLYLPDVRPLSAEELGVWRELADGLAFGIVTQRGRSERRQAAKEIARQAALLDRATDAIFVRGLDDRITYWNKGAARLYGWSAAEVAGRSSFELLHQGDAAEINQATARLRTAGEWSGELSKFTRDGRKLTIEARWTLLRDERGEPEAILAINTDVTERRKLEGQFLRAQRMESIGTLAGGIAHDLNNLLAPIMMSVGLLQQFNLGREVEEVLATVHLSAKRGSDLVRQVLSFARGVEGIRVAVKLPLLVHEIAGLIASTFPKNIIFTPELAADLTPTLGDPTQLNQVLVNLCVNARDAMPHGGKLTLKGSNLTIDEHYAAMNGGVSPGSYVVLEITDTGTGMSKAVIDRIFEPFFTTKEQGRGTGLGLSTTLGIVRSHAGFVHVYSEVGKGSTFKVYLPALTTPTGDGDAGPHALALPRGHGELILVVDDEPTILGITQQTLESFGYRVLTAVDGAQAIALFAQRRTEIAAVLTDMMMPVMDGPALIAALLRIDPHAQIIAASGLHTNGHVARAAGLGIKKFLPKPYTADALLTALRDALSPRGSRAP